MSQGFVQISQSNFEPLQQLLFSKFCRHTYLRLKCNISSFPVIKNNNVYIKNIVNINKKFYDLQD